jgi:hypothetical protein
MTIYGYVDNNNARLYCWRSSTSTSGDIQSPSGVARCTVAGIHVVGLAGSTSRGADAIGADVIGSVTLSAD